ncbi:hypothetical protein [Streptomyces viridochromogenes]|uniref:hypothetical protein n=1 Tax=Streptomyces viridochromogenes TaxID=1938 RepID=UPI001FCC4B1F|nr:hypothetical protein [Streptomyces viridochromogenes]
MTTEPHPSGGPAGLARSLTVIGGGGAGTLTAALTDAPWWAVVALGFATLTPPAVALVLTELIPQESEHRLALWRTWCRRQ